MATRSALLEVAVNGQRSEPVIPSTPTVVAAAARAAVAAGARVVHLHPRDRNSTPTLDGDACAATVLAVREACPALPCP